MEYEILYQPSYALLKLDLEESEQINAEAGALVSMSSGISIETGMKGGLFGGLKRSLLGGESFFINKFTAESPGEINMAPPLPGDIHAIDLQEQMIFVQSGSFMSATTDIDIDTKWGGSKTFFSREGLFLLKIEGTGKLFASSFGAIHPINLEAEEKYIVDTGHIVAFEEGVGYNVKKIGGMKSTLFSGEGLVVELTGPGKAWIQSRSEDSFLSWLIPRLPDKG
ncbi:MAG: TIGR00266 family protein [Methanobacteriaceae archaeon]|nr:TIGR00266 family protein [Methanobacteriaceae archaeon]